MYVCMYVCISCHEVLPLQRQYFTPCNIALVGAVFYTVVCFPCRGGILHSDMFPLQGRYFTPWNIVLAGQYFTPRNIAFAGQYFTLWNICIGGILHCALNGCHFCHRILPLVFRIFLVIVCAVC